MNLGTLAGQPIIVTGAASGLGQASVSAALAAGASVCACDLDAERLAAVWSADHGDREQLLLVGADVSKIEAGGVLVEATRKRFGGVRALVNAAGVFDTRPLLAIEPVHFDRIFDVHVRGAFFLMQTVAQALVEENQGGSIVNFSSTAGRHPRPLAAHYGAAKAAVISFTRSAAVALAPQRIRVNCVCPGLIETPMIDEIREQRAALLGSEREEITARWEELVPMGRLGTPQEVAELVVFLLSDASSYLTGEAIGVTGGTDAS